MVTPSSAKNEIHRAKHGLINAETAMTLTVHRLLNTVQNGSSQGSKGAASSTADKSRAVFYLSKASTCIYLLLQILDVSSYLFVSLSSLSYFCQGRKEMVI